MHRDTSIPPEWNPLTRIAFRFCFSYFGLYILAIQIFGSLLLIPYFQFRGLGPLWPMREITIWVAAHIFSITTPLIYAGDSIGETSFFWVQMFWILAIAIVATGLWSFLDRKRKHYAALHKWFHVFIRLALASQMFEYGMTKVISNQFRAPPLVTLIQPVGNVSLEGLLWASIGAAPAYETHRRFHRTLRRFHRHRREVDRSDERLQQDMEIQFHVSTRWIGPIDSRRRHGQSPDSHAASAGRFRYFSPAQQHV